MAPAKDESATYLGSHPKEAATHLALSGLDAWRASHPGQTGGLTESELRERVAALVPGVDLGEKEISDTVGEM